MFKTDAEIIKNIIEQDSKKDIESLKEEIGELPCVDTVFNSDGSSYIDSAVPVMAVYDLLDQLDEPEVLSQELPVIPKFVAEWISKHHEKFDLYPALRRLEEGSTRDYDAYKWYRANTLKFVNAYLTGKYEVEEEQRYIIKIGNLYLAEPLGDMTSDIVRMTRDKEVAYQFTDEKSIATHLDKFEGTSAVKVEELEE